MWINTHDSREYPVRILCTDEAMNEIADFSAKHYQKHAIMYYVISNEVHIREYDSGRKFKPRIDTSRLVVYNQAI